MNDQKQYTTILPNSWTFNKVGNTRLKRKRKHNSEITQEDKHIEWLVFCLKFWKVKVNRDQKSSLLAQLKTKSKMDVEEIIKLKRSDDQTT